jgi:hypothetical protein
VTNRVVDITCKGKDPKTVPNRTNYIFCTNYEDALPLKQGDRRFAVLKTKWQNREDLVKWEKGEGAGFYKNLYAAMRSDPEGIKYGLENVEIPDWFKDMQVAPITEGTKDMIQASKSQGLKDLEYLIEEYDLAKPAIRLDVIKVCADESDIELPTHPAAIKHAFEDLGYGYSSRLKIDGYPVTVYMTSKLDNATVRNMLK